MNTQYTIQIFQPGYPTDPDNTIQRVVNNGVVRFDNKRYRVFMQGSNGLLCINIDSPIRPPSQAIGIGFSSL